MDSEIIIVSGLPRSGTSLMMQMLRQGGIDIVTDEVRRADTDNPKGYCEFEQVKAIERDSSWIPATRGRAFKMVSQLLYHLPMVETYRIIFMERDLEEVLSSQEKMLEHLGRVPPPRAKIGPAFLSHLKRLHEWLDTRPNMSVLRVKYLDLVERPTEQAARVRGFIGEKGDIERMVNAVDPSLYRNKKVAGASVAGNPA
jgi:Sulfotransferase domain